MVEADLVVEVERGAGRATLEGDRVQWTLGRLPIHNTLRVSTPSGASETVSLIPSLAEPLAHEVFGEVQAFFDAEGTRGSTEDLAFVDEHIVLGVDQGLLRVDAEGMVSQISVSGAPLGGVLGVALDAEGALWIADSDNGALERVDSEGVVSTALDGLDGPNYVAIGPDGHVYVTDPCAGEVIRYDPVAEEVVARHTFDLPTEGGPNGIAFDANGRLWGVTESTALLCNHGDTVELTAPIAVLFALDVTEAGFGERENVIESIGLFGDGIAFDAENNLYYVADTTEGLMLQESAIWVLPEGEATPTKLLVAGERALFANLAFGSEAFGPTTLYLAMLAFPGFADERGLRRVEVGIAGLPLLH